MAWSPYSRQALSRGPRIRYLGDSARLMLSDLYRSSHSKKAEPPEGSSPGDARRSWGPGPSSGAHLRSRVPDRCVTWWQRRATASARSGGRQQPRDLAGHQMLRTRGCAANRSRGSQLAASWLTARSLGDRRGSRPITISALVIASHAPGTAELLRSPWLVGSRDSLV